MNLSVVGLGKLGLCIATILTVKGYRVIGVDINKGILTHMRKGTAPFFEPDLQNYLEKSEHRLTVADDFSAAIEQSDITFLVLPTPSTRNGSFSDTYLRDALKQLSSALRKSNKPFHVFSIVSTLSPGTTLHRLIPLIERLSGREYNKGFGMAYNPSFIALGSVIHDFLFPDLVLIGQSSIAVGDQLEAVYSRVCENRPRIARMSITSAEITKLSLNAYVTMKISFANTLSTICEQIPEADLDDITRALGADKRIAAPYLRGGLSFGGPCFPRDNRAFASFAERYRVPAYLARSTDKVNQYQAKHIVQRIERYIRSADRNVTVFGIAYKANTPVIDESPALKIIDELLKKAGTQITVYDPLAESAARAHFGRSVYYARSLQEGIDRSSVYLVSSDGEEFRKIPFLLLAGKPVTLFDPWRIFAGENFSDGIRYIPIGMYASA